MTARGRARGLALAAAVLAAASTGCDADRSGAASADRAGAAADTTFTGICDASAAVALGDRLFAVADDEDSVLRVYDADRGGEPVRSVDFSDVLFPPKEEKAGKKKSKKSGRKKPPESDLEAAARIGDVAYWMTSHGRNRAGKRKDARLLFFATTARDGGDDLEPVGRPYEHLLEDLTGDARYARFDLAAAAERAPKVEGGLNLEGLGERPGGGLWIGFRNPIPEGRALVAPLLNPERVVHGERARLGDPVQLDLGGLGIRSLSRWRGVTWIVAGPYAEGEGARLFSWDGAGAPAPLAGVDLSDFNPEGFFAAEGRDEILLLSDDGTLEIDGEPCKRLDEAERKRFRGRWIVPSADRRGIVSPR